LYPDASVLTVTQQQAAVDAKRFYVPTGRKLGYKSRARRIRRAELKPIACGNTED
jgi:hypothetical protein